MTLHLTLPWPPSLNRIYKPKGKSIRLADVAHDYKKAASAALPVGRVPPPLTGRLMVWMVLHPPLKLANARWDIANREKLMIDCLTAQRVWLDDSQIDALVMLRGEPSGTGRVELTIQTLEPGVPPL